MNEELKRIEAVLDEKVRPALRSHGGELEIDRLEGRVLYVKLLGQCAGCPSADLTNETVIEAEGVRIFCCHGNKYGVKSTLARLAARAKELDCTLALYGHTHRAGIADVDGVLCVNPGAAGDYVSPSYCYLAVHGEKTTPVIVPIGH